MSAVRLVLLAVALWVGGHAEAQVNGGRQAFAFLEMPVSARLTGLGGQLISVRDGDIGLGAGNPAALSAKSHHQLQFHHQFHYAGIGAGYVGYGHHHAASATTFQGGVQYLRYGDIPGRDIFNQPQGFFQAADLAVLLGASRQWEERLQYGINVRLIQSTLEAYRSLALAADAGVYYENPDRLYSVGMVLRHMGGQLRTYQDGGAREALPFQALIGISKRLRYLPFRLSVTGHTLERWNVRYDDPAMRVVSTFPGQEPEPENRFARGVDNLFRHLLFSGEFLLGKSESFRLRVAYDHRLRREMLVTGYGGLSGFSGGFGFKVSRFQFDYGFGIYHLAGATHHISLGTRLQEFFPGLGRELPVGQ